MRKTFLHFLLISVLGIIVYSNTLKSPFIWDDILFILGNENVRNLANFTDLSGTRYLTFLSFAVNYRINGYDVAGYHIFNIAVHILNALLLYSLVVMIFKTPFLREGPICTHSHRLALFAGLLFISHPVYTQAVTNINQRSILLATFFYLLSIISFIKSKILLMGHRSEVKGKESDNEHSSVSHRPIAHYLSPIAYYLISLLSAVLAMKCKEIAFTLPLIIVLCERYFFGHQWSLKKSFIYLIPILLTLLIIPLSTPQADVFNSPEAVAFRINNRSVLTGLSEQVLSNIPRKEYTLTEFRVIPTYIRLFFLPLNLNLDYDYPVFSSFLEPDILLSFVFLLLMAGLAVYLYYLSRFTSHASRLISLGILWFFITLSIESVVVVLNYVIFEYRLYLPSIGIILLLMAFTGYGLSYSKRASRYLSVVLIIVVPTLSIATYARNEFFRDETTLWKDVIKKSPNLTEAHYNLAVAYDVRNMPDNAIEEYKTVLKGIPDYADAHNRLGTAYYNKGLLDMSVEEYKMALTANPGDLEAHYNLGILYDKQGLLKEAAQQFKTALTLNPYHADSHKSLGIVYDRQGLLKEAIEQFKTALKLRPAYVEALNNLGIAYDKQGRLEEAAQQFIAALRVNPDNVEAHNNMGTAYLKQGKIREAIMEYRAALKIKPDYAVALENLRYADKRLRDKP